MPASRDAHAGKPLRLLTLGRAAVVDQAGTVIVDQRRRIALLTIVAAAGERGVPRDKLLAYLSPERSTESARHSLHQLLYYLRQQAGTAIFAGSDPLRTNPALLDYEVAHFDIAFDAHDYERAVAMYRGPFLDGFHLSEAAEFDEWASGERRRLALRHQDALLALARSAREAGDHLAALRWSQQLLATDPFHVPATLESMGAMNALHDRAGALRLANDVQRRLIDEFGAVDPEIAARAAAVRGAAAPTHAVDVAQEISTEPEGTVQSLAARFVSPVTAHDSESPANEHGPLRPLQAKRSSRRVAVGLLAVVIGIAVSVRFAAPSSWSAQRPHVVATRGVENEAGDSVTYLAQGLEHSVTDTLHRQPGILLLPASGSRVSPDSTGAAQTAAPQHRADVVLRSRLVREHDTLRFVTELMDAAGTPIQVTRFIVTTATLATLPRVVADSIAVALRLQPSANVRRVPRDGAARLRIMQADHFLLNRDDQSLRRAQSLLVEAIDLDPTDAEAYTRLSSMYGIRGSYGLMPVSQAFELANAAARRALELDPSQTAAIANLAHERNVRYWQWDEGEKELRRALALEPWRATTWNMLGTSLRMTGRFDDARDAVERARSLDPLARHYTLQIGHVYRCAGQLDSALAWFRRALIISPTYVTPHVMIADVQAKRGFPDSALAEWRVVAEMTKDTALVALLARRSDRAALDEFLVRRAHLFLQRMTKATDRTTVSSFSLATLQAAVGDTARALDLLEQAASERDPSLPELGCITAFEPLRQSARFVALMRRMHLTERSFGLR